MAKEGLQGRNGDCRSPRPNFLGQFATNEGVKSVLLIEAAERPGDPGLVFRRRLNDNVRWKRKCNETMTNKIRLSLSIHKPDTEIAKNAVAAYDGLKDNPNFVNPPVPLDVFKAAIDDYA